MIDLTEYSLSAFQYNEDKTLLRILVHWQTMQRCHWTDPSSADSSQFGSTARL